MDKCQNFKHNLILVQKVHDRSLGEYAAELAMPKSTVQSVLADGNTTLFTAAHIAEQLHISLDSLLGDEIPVEQHSLLLCCLQHLAWFASLPPEKQRTVLRLMEELLK